MQPRMTGFVLAASMAVGVLAPAAQAGRRGNYYGGYGGYSGYRSYGGNRGYHRGGGGIRLGNLTPLVILGALAYAHEQGRKHGVRQRDREYTPNYSDRSQDYRYNDRSDYRDVTPRCEPPRYYQPPPCRETVYRHKIIDRETGEVVREWVDHDPYN